MFDLQGRKQDGSLKKRKKWSFRFGRDKSAEAEAETSKSELLPSPTPAEQSLQGRARSVAAGQTDGPVPARAL